LCDGALVCVCVCVLSLPLSLISPVANSTPPM
jgi:hypothetical protein